ncbi:TauD/TfdA family dioxygenase [Sorangium sp. So ce281]|uniref:TauD/TfdA family dioxygenase n=1 Tax=unclassified Sorangium TaxID=2621164 RepID=UPI003F610080
MRELIAEIPGVLASQLVRESDRLQLVTCDRPGMRLAELARQHKGALEALLARAGGVLFRGFGVTEAEFAEVVGALCEPLPYVYRSTPRTEVGERIYTATEYPAARDIPMHCENAYQRDWPLRLFFFCDRAASRGGETPLADVARVTEALDPALVDRFARKRVMYVRNYRPGLDLPWQTVFQTSERGEVERYCAVHDIAWEWIEGDALRTRQVCDALAAHPVTGCVLWFNQAHLFHVSSLPAAARNAMLSVYAEDELPRHALFGDGSPIDEADLDRIRAAFAAHTVTFPWRTGDVLVLDNMSFAHGRRPFEGDRRVLVAMGDAFSRAGFVRRSQLQ